MDIYPFHVRLSFPPRGVIKPGDVATFDALTTKLDGNTYEELNDHVLGDTKNGDNKQTDLGMTTNIVISNRGE